MKKLFLLLLTVMPLTLCGQVLNWMGAMAEDMLPENWKCESAYGDMNKDGLTDLALIAFPEDKTAAPLLAVYWGARNGLYNLYRLYPGAFPANDNEFAFPEYDLSITDKGVMVIEYSLFMSAGSWNTSKDTFRFRFQDGDFFLIGMDTGGLSRNTGEVTEDSFNFLTHKRQTRQFNAMEGDEDNGKVKEKWTRIPKVPLQRLSEWNVEVYPIEVGPVIIK